MSGEGLEDSCAQLAGAMDKDWSISCHDHAGNRVRRDGLWVLGRPQGTESKNPLGRSTAGRVRSNLGMTKRSISQS